MLSVEEILELAGSLDIKVHDLLRPRSPIFQEQKEHLLAMEELELARIIASEPTLIKRPIIRGTNGYVVGFDEDKIRDLIQADLQNEAQQG
jgi:arsenate reductase-like glutaredoxin family protein